MSATTTDLQSIRYENCLKVLTNAYRVVQAILRISPWGRWIMASAMKTKPALKVCADNEFKRKTAT